MRPGNWTHTSERAQGPTITWIDPANDDRDNPRKTMVSANCCCGMDAAEEIAPRYWDEIATDVATTYWGVPNDYAFEIEILLPKGWAGKFKVTIERVPSFAIEEVKAEEKVS